MYDDGRARWFVNRLGFAVDYYTIIINTRVFVIFGTSVWGPIYVILLTGANYGVKTRFSRHLRDNGTFCERVISVPRTHRPAPYGRKTR